MICGAISNIAAPYTVGEQEPATMSENTCTSADYTMGYSEEFRQMLNWRSARSHAAYLLPHLASGQKLLDFGCGPGTISVGLARAVEPGDLHGIDMEESQIGLARAAAQAGGHANATFHAGDATPGTALRPGSSSTSGAAPSTHGRTTPAPSGALPSGSAWRSILESAWPRRRARIPAHQGNDRRPAGSRYGSFPQPLAWGARRGNDAKWCPDGSPSFP